MVELLRCSVSLADGTTLHSPSPHKADLLNSLMGDPEKPKDLPKVTQLGSRRLGV